MGGGGRKDGGGWWEERKFCWRLGGRSGLAGIKRRHPCRRRRPPDSEWLIHLRSRPTPTPLFLGLDRAREK